MVKKKLKNIVGNWCSNFDYPIIVNSYGRSGSTVLTNSIKKSAIESKNERVRNIAFRSISQCAWDLESSALKGGIVYKSHDYPPSECFKNDVRMLYTFTEPVDVVLSLLRLHDERGEEWMKEHYKHLKVPYTNFRDIVNEDQLQLEKHLDSWLQEERFPIAFIKYETMWEHQDDISEFLGFKVELPPFKERKANEQRDKDLIRKLQKTYKPLRTKIKNMDDFFTNRQL